MSNVIRLKRRAAAGSAGAPAALASAEPAYNENDDTLYYGYGDNGSGQATSIVPIGGKGAFVDKTTDQTIGGNKTFSNAPLVPTQSAADSSTKAASTGFVQSQFQSVVGATKAKITYNAKGLVTGGADLVAADIPTITTGKLSDFNAAVAAFRLDQFAAPTASVSFGSQKVTSVADATADSDAPNLGQLKALIQNRDPKDSVRLTLSATDTLSGLAARQGVTPNAGDRIAYIVAGASAGLYVASAGAWSRSTDADSSAKVTTGLAFFTEEGDNAGRRYVLNTPGPITLGTTSLNFTIDNGGITYTAGNGLQLTGAAFSVLTANSARIVVSGAGIDLASGVIATPGTYRSVTIDTYGRVTGGTNPTTLSGYGITDAQPLDATLTGLAALTVAAGQVPYGSGADTFSTQASSSFGRGLWNLADQAAGRSAFGLGTMATQNANAVAITGGSIDGISLDGGTF